MSDLREIDRFYRADCRGGNAGKMGLGCDCKAVSTAQGGASVIS